MRNVKALVPWGLMGLGVLILVTSLMEAVSLATRQQQLGFADSARFLRIAVVAEAVVVTLATLLALRASRWPNRLPILAGLIWLLSVTDVIFLAQATVMPT
jgi:anti-sigma-K factor RskA